VGEIVGKLERSHASEVRQIDAWTREEVAQILDLAREWEPRAYPIFHLLFSTGMRRGEALGLKWDAVGWPGSSRATYGVSVLDRQADSLGLLLRAHMQSEINRPTRRFGAGTIHTGPLDYL
jgi:integrase